MTGNPYEPCPCGSGKKFKWCCQPIHAQLEKAYQQEADGQHEAALRTIEDIVAANPDNPEVYGRKAQLLYSLERFEEGESALNKAFSINPKYPFGHQLKGKFLMAMGDLNGALAELRQAADAYDVPAAQTLAAVYAAIADCESRMQRFLAVRAALEKAIHLDNTVPSYREALERGFGKESPLPDVAKKEYGLMSLPKNAPDERKKIWNASLQKHTTGKLGDAVVAYQELVASDHAEKEAWYNLGICRAWLGENMLAIEALEKYIDLEDDVDMAVEAYALVELLRCSGGVDLTKSTFLEHSMVYKFSDGQKVVKMLQELESSQRLVATDIREDRQMITGVMVEKPQVMLAGVSGKKAPRYAAHIMIFRNIIRIWSPNKDQLNELTHELEQISEGALADGVYQSNECQLQDVIIESVIFPLSAANEEEAKAEVETGYAKFYEDIWIHRPLRTLSSLSPLELASHPHKRKQLLGVIRFMESIAQSAGQNYDFDRLRRKLGLIQTTSNVTPGAEQDITAMNAAELAALDRQTLSDEQLEQGYQTARKLDAGEIMIAFLLSLIERPVNAQKPDRFPYFQLLAETAFRSGEYDLALQYVDKGTQQDNDANSSARQNDYDLWRGRIFAKQGDKDQATTVFKELIERAPDEMRYLSTATETMLSAGAGGVANEFAQKGLALARKKQDRDSEEHFLELSAAAQKRM